MKPLAALALSSALLVAALSFASGQDPQDLPSDETGLWARANQLFDADELDDAEAALRQFLKSFPKSRHAPKALEILKEVLEGSRRRGDLVSIYRAHIAANSPAWRARLGLAHLLQELEFVNDARTEFRALFNDSTDSCVRSAAADAAWRIDDKRLTVEGVDGPYIPGTEAGATIGRHGIDKLTVRVFRIEPAALTRALEAEPAKLRDALERLRTHDRTPVKEWVDERNEESSQWIEIPSKEPGLYLVELEHDGLRKATTVSVSRAALVVRSGLTRFVALAQDRETGRPIAGMNVFAVNGTKKAQGTTDASGLFVADAFPGGAVFGIKDGEIAVCQGWGHDEPPTNTLCYVTTDRPIYRPNHTVNYKIVVRRERGERQMIERGLRVRVTIQDPKYNAVQRETLTLNAHGSASGSFTLGDEPRLGKYTIRTGPDLPGNDESPEWGNPWSLNDISPTHITFRVDEYRKPEFKVAVSHDRATYMQGDEMRTTVQADYYHGGPVVEADVEYNVFRRRDWSWAWWDWYCDWYDTDEEESDDDWYGLGSNVGSGTGKTDAQGRFSVSIPIEKWAKGDAVYSVVARVTDLSRRAVDGKASAKAAAAEYRLGAYAAKYVFKAGAPAEIRVRATTIADAPAVADVKCVVSRIVWQDQTTDSKVVFEGSTRTDDHGNGAMRFTLAECGYYKAELTSTDKQGNNVQSETGFWVCRDEWEDAYGFTDIQIQPDRKTYTSGETASVLITSHQKNLTALVTVESADIYSQQVVKIKGHGAVIDVKLDRPELAPTAFVTVTAIKDGQVFTAEKRIIVNPVERFLTVRVTSDKTEYRPRETARYTIETIGADGKPVSAEVSLGVVDEAIYALQPEYAKDIRRHFIHRRLNEVRGYTSMEPWDWEELPIDTAYNRGENSGTPLTGSTFALDESKSSTDSGEAPTLVRSNFADTMHWVAHVVTDSSGRAIVEAAVPDNLTTWRATVRAASDDGRYGQATSTSLARKNVIVRLALPRFYTQNDTATLSAVAHNYLEVEKNFRVVLEVDGLEVAGALETRATIAAQGQQRFDWTVTARKPGTAKVTVKVLSDVESDAMQLAVPILPHGSLQWRSWAGALDKRTEQTFTLPADVNGGDVMILVTPTHAAAVTDAIEYLAGYPYGCVEQTMSRFLPTVIVAQTLQKLGLEKPALAKELPKMVARGLQRLYGFQHDDGGWGWWQHDPTNPRMTAYVMIGLTQARDAKFMVAEGSYARGILGLKEIMKLSHKDLDLETRAYVMYALSVCGDTSHEWSDYVFQNASTLSPYGKSLVALAHMKRGQIGAAQNVLNPLTKAAHVSGAHAWWGDDKRHGWFDHSAEVTAAVLRAYLAVDPKHELVEKIVLWLESVRDGRCWSSTKQTALVVQALCEYLVVSGDASPDMMLGLTVNGKQLYREHVTRDTWQKFERARVIPLSDLPAGENRIVIEKEGTGKPTWSIYLRQYTNEENMAASKDGLLIERRYARVFYEKGQRWTERLDNDSTVKSGDEIEVTLVLTADKAYEYLMIDDPLPSGFEVERERIGEYDWDWWYSRKEFRDERVSVAITRMPAGMEKITYVMRAETPGSLHVLPARVWNMYFPQIGGNSAESRIKVVEK